MLLTTDNKVCDTLPIEFVNEESNAVATVSLLFHADTGTIETVKMSLFPAILNAEPKARKYYLAHEWSHVRIAQIATTPIGLEHIQRQAATTFGQRLNTRLDQPKAGELLTDCMA